jgi:hypothetical protein
MENRINAAEKGPMCCARTLAATNVPPQKKAEKKSLIYVVIKEGICIIAVRSVSVDKADYLYQKIQNKKREIWPE